MCASRNPPLAVGAVAEKRRTQSRLPLAIVDGRCFGPASAHRMVEENSYLLGEIPDYAGLRGASTMGFK
jgi:hypothetical protein